MVENIFRDDYKYMACAFDRFFALKSPVLIDTRSYPDTHRNTMHNHDFPQLWYCLSGRYQHYVNGRTYDCEKGSVVMVAPGVVHKLLVPEGERPEIQSLNVLYDTFLEAPADQYIHAIANLFLRPFAKELDYSFEEYKMLSPTSQAALENITSWFASLSFNLHDPVDKVDIYKKLEELFSLPEFAIPEGYWGKAVWLAQTRMRPMIRALVYVNTHYAERIQEDELVRASGTCRANLYRFFKQYTGCTYAVYLQWLRTRHVFAYLTFTTYPISYISDICGFTNHAYMSKIFYKYMGVTPSAFRAEQKKWLAEQPEKRARIMPRF